jgi:hypothetical protein
MPNGLVLLPASQRSTLDEARCASLGERDVDDIEVPGHDRLGKDRPRLPRDLRTEVAVREVRQGEQANSGDPRELRRGERGRVARLLRADLLLVGEGAVVNEDLGILSNLEDRPGRPRVACEHDLPAPPRRPEHLLWPDLDAVVQGHPLAALERAEERPGGNAERGRRLDVEAARPSALDYGVADRGAPMVDAERDDPILAAIELVSGTELHELVAVREFPEDASERFEELEEPGRPVDGERQLATAQRKGLHHPGKAEVVIGVIVGDEDLRKLNEADPRAKKLALRTLAAVEEEPLAAAAHEQAGRGAPSRRNGPGRAEEHKVEVHAGKCTAARSTPRQRGM